MIWLLGGHNLGFKRELWKYWCGISVSHLENFWMNWFTELLIHKYKKKNIKIPSKREKIIIYNACIKLGWGYFVLLFKTWYFYPVNQNVIMFSYFVYSVQITTQKSFKIFFPTRSVLRKTYRSLKGTQICFFFFLF